MSTYEILMNTMSDDQVATAPPSSQQDADRDVVTTTTNAKTTAKSDARKKSDRAAVIKQFGRVRAVTATVNNADRDLDAQQKLYSERVSEHNDNYAAQITYYLVTAEHLKQGTYHEHHLLHMSDPKGFEFYEKLLPGGHIEKVKSLKQMYIYCMKGDKISKADWDRYKDSAEDYGLERTIVFEYGTQPHQGKSSGKRQVADLVLQGASDYELATTMPVNFMQNHAAIKALRCAYASKKRDASKPITVMVFYGPTACGKSFMARQFDDDAYVYDVATMDKWMDGYTGQNTIVLDEFRGQLTFSTLLKMTDRYGMQVQNKGGSVQISADTILITAPKHPKDWYPNLANDEGNIDQLQRRIKKIVYFPDKFDPDLAKEPKMIDMTDQSWKSEFDPTAQFGDIVDLAAIIRPRPMAAGDTRIADLMDGTADPNIVGSSSRDPVRRNPTPVPPPLVRENAFGA